MHLGLFIHLYSVCSSCQSICILYVRAVSQLASVFFFVLCITIWYLSILHVGVVLPLVHWIWELSIHLYTACCLCVALSFNTIYNTFCWNSLSIFRLTLRRVGVLYCDILYNRCCIFSKTPSYSSCSVISFWYLLLPVKMINYE